MCLVVLVALILLVLLAPILAGSLGFVASVLFVISHTWLVATAVAVVITIKILNRRMKVKP